MLLSLYLLIFQINTLSYDKSNINIHLKPYRSFSNEKLSYFIDSDYDHDKKALFILDILNAKVYKTADLDEELVTVSEKYIANAFVRKISVHSDFITLMGDNTLLFNKNGKYINHLLNNNSGTGYKVFSENKKLNLLHRSLSNDSILYSSISDIGKINKHINIIDKKNLETRQITKGFLFNEGFIFIAPYEYKIIFYTKDKEVLNYDHKFLRIKEKKSKNRIVVARGLGVVNSATLTNNMNEHIEENYKPDIMEIIGQFKNYLFIRIASSKTNLLKFDVINLENKSYRTYMKTVKGIITSTKISKDKLVVNQRIHDKSYIDIFTIIQTN